MKAVFFVGLAGFLVSLGVLVVSLLLPIVNGPRTSWDEALFGIIPGALCSALFFFVSVVGLILMLNAGSSPPRRPRLEVDEEEPKERPRRRRSRDY